MKSTEVLLEHGWALTQSMSDAIWDLVQIQEPASPTV